MPSVLVAAGVAWELDFYVTTKFRQGYDQLALYELSVMLADNHVREHLLHRRTHTTAPHFSPLTLIKFARCCWCDAFRY